MQSFIRLILESHFFETPSPLIRKDTLSPSRKALMSLRFITPFLLFLAFLPVPAQACLDEGNPAPVIIGEAAFISFKDNLTAMKRADFVERYCRLEKEDRALAIRIFDSAATKKSNEDRMTLLRMAIMVPDIEENLRWVAENGRVREEGEGWESVAIRRFVMNVRMRFPQTQSVLDKAYLGKIELIYAAALGAIREKEIKADQQISSAKDKIAEYERKQAKLRYDIEQYRQERRLSHVMQHQLESQR